VADALVLSIEVWLKPWGPVVLVLFVKPQNPLDQDTGAYPLWPITAQSKIPPTNTAALR
jgi:hypothetical protein